MKIKKILLSLILILGLPLASFAYPTFFCTPYDDVLTPFVQMLDLAHKTVLIAAYSLTQPSIIDELIKLHNNGVDVEIILDKTQAGGTKEKVQIARLVQAGITPTIGQSVKHHLMHLKLAIVDYRYVASGSWNMSDSASLEDNIMDFVDDQSRAISLAAFWAKVKDDMDAATTRSINGRSHSK